MNTDREDTLAERVGTKPLVSVMTPCFNEVDNVVALYERIKAAFALLPGYRYEHIFIDNASTDGTVDLIKSIARTDRSVKLIVNNRNFGHIRSPLHGFFQARGDAVIVMASDLQDPPELIPQYVTKWADGYKVVIGVKPKSRETALMACLRRWYYSLVGSISEVPLIPNFTGFGLYDREVVESVRETGDRYPYFRGMIADMGYPRAEIPFEQPRRERGITKNNFYSLYDTAMLGITSHSKVPLRIATIFGFTVSIISLLVAVGYLVAKLLFWNSFSLGTAPLVIGVFFLGAVQLFFVGIVGEYIGAIHTQIHKRPLVTEKERINFENSAIPGSEDRSGRHDV
jgi:glycosyltransferase involved in cell wall biosynthesis